MPSKIRKSRKARLGGKVAKRNTAEQNKKKQKNSVRRKSSKEKYYRAKYRNEKKLGSSISR